MRVLLTSATRSDQELATSALEKVKQCAKVDRFGTHTLTDDPQLADLILFVETDQGIGPFGVPLRTHPYVRQMPDKCFAYNSSDNPVAHLPGLYASLEKARYDPTRTRTAHYLSTHITVPAAKSKPMGERDLLFSFVGNARNAPVRGALMQLQHARGKCVDTSTRNAFVWQDPDQRAAFVDDYADVLADTKFALCPRGCGASSMRLFEAMRVGCVPVVLSDPWVPPSGPPWEDFAVLVPERDAGRLPDLLQGLESSAEARGELARQVWQDWFSDEVTFHRLVEWCCEIMRARHVSEAKTAARWLTLSERLWPQNARATLRWLKALGSRELRIRLGRQ